MSRDYAALLDAVLAQAGLGPYPDASVAQLVGWIVIAVNVLGLVVAIGVCVPRLRTHRVAFWIPLAIGAACLVLTVGLTMGAALADPAFTAKLTAGS